MSALTVPGLILGCILMFIGGGLLHDVPFPRFIIAFLCICIGNTILNGRL